MLLESIVVVCVLVLVPEIDCHGMMLVPPNRSSLWRFNDTAPINYNDNQNFCGGVGPQWDLFGGKCGPCGDRFDDTHPQSNENTGIYGRGIVVAQYASGSVINVQVLLTANHNGFFRYSLCVLKDAQAPEYDENCFNPLSLSDGSSKYTVLSSDTLIHNAVKLPNKLTCDRCVLRWDYTAGNNWGNCGNGKSALGCGPQETFRSCADVQIR